LRHQRLLIPTVILFLFLFPLTVYAAEDHMGHGISHGDVHTGEVMDMHEMSHVPQKHDLELGRTRHSDEGGHDDTSHEAVSRTGGLEPYKNEVVGSFAGLNALIIAAAALLKRNGPGV